MIQDFRTPSLVFSQKKFLGGLKTNGYCSFEQWAIVSIVFLLFLFFNLRGAITFKGGQKLFRGALSCPSPCSRKTASHGGLVKKSVSHTSLLFDKTLKRRSIDRIFSWTTILRDHDRACRHKFTVVALNSI